MAPTRSLRSHNKPRRRTSTASSQPRRRGSWDLLENSEEARLDLNLGNQDAMDIDDARDRESGRFRHEMRSLRDMAERIGREVELFAEKLDSLKAGPELPPHLSKTELAAANYRAKTRAALELVKEYRSVAEETVQRLGRMHTAARARDLRRQWKRAFGHYADSMDDESNLDNDPANTTPEDLRRWQAELATWQLVDGVLECETGWSDVARDEERARIEALQEPDSRFDGDGKPWIDFLAGNKQAQEASVILRWLETTAEQTGDDLELIQEEVGKIMGTGSGIWTQGWLETRERLKAEKRLRQIDGPIEDLAQSAPWDLFRTNGTNRLATQLDPDATSRQNRVLETGDANIDKSFWMVCWEMLRRGRSMREIREWCLDQNEYPKALSIGAHASSHTGTSNSKTMNARYRWRKACRHAAGCERLNEYERAVFGVLGGDTQATERICKSWEDVLYSHYNAMLVAQYEVYVLNNGAEFLPPATLFKFGGMASHPSFHTNSTSSKGIIESLQMDGAFRLHASEPLKLVQASILAHDLEDFLVEQGVALARRAREKPDSAFFPLVTGSTASLIPDQEPILSVTEDYNALRVLVHVWIIFREVFGFKGGPAAREEAIENVVAAYIAFLLSAGKLSLIPLYAATMSSNRGDRTMAHTLSAVENTQEREEIVELMRENQWKIEKLILMQWQSAMEASPLPHELTNNVQPIHLVEQRIDREKGFLLPRVSPPTTEPLEDYEEFIISSLEWIEFPEVNWTTAVRCLSRTALLFLVNGRLQAAVALYRRLPFSKIAEAKMKVPGGLLDTEQTATQARGGSRGKSTRSNASGGPKHSRAPANTADDTSQAQVFEKYGATYAQMGQLVAAIEALWEWRLAEDDVIGQRSRVDENSPPARSGADCIKRLDEAMEPLLQDQNFMSGPSKDITADQLQRLKDAYLPEIVLAYNSALHVAGHRLGRQNFITSLDLATQVAENETLVSSFKKGGRMARFVHDIAQTSAAMLRKVEEDSQRDPPRKQKKLKSGKTLGIWDIKP